MKQIAILWNHVTGYTQAVLHALLAFEDVHLLVVQLSSGENDAFTLAIFDRCEFIRLDQIDDAGLLYRRLQAFAPDVAVISATKDVRYQEAAHQVKLQGGVTIWASDLPGRALWRDAYGMVRSRLQVLPDFDAALVPGYKGMEYARRLGFPEERIFSGLYSCDTELFRPIGVQRHLPENRQLPWPKVFLYVGQFIERKGIDTLLTAYQRYRKDCSLPWELWCGGAGPMRGLLENQPGIRMLDFLTPQECARVMGQCGIFIMPSKWDHWGVVLHEAACAGMPILTSRNCFGHVELVQQACNGYTFAAGDVASLAHWMGVCANEQLAREMGENSLRLSYRFDPVFFARLVLEQIPMIVRAQPH